MKPEFKLALALGAGVLGLVALHALTSGQSVAQAASSIGATISAPFAVSTDAGGTISNAVSSSSSASGTAATASTAQAVAGSPTILADAPPGIDPTGWEAALAGMASVSSGNAPGSAYTDLSPAAQVTT